MNRRNFISSSAALAVSSIFVPELAMSAETKAPNEELAKSLAKSLDSGVDSLMKASVNCMKEAELCLQHCVESLSTGNTAMAACAGTVRDMMIYCEALSKAVARKSKHTKELAKIAYAACTDCEKECRKHKNMEVCLRCADACAGCANECKKAMA